MKGTVVSLWIQSFKEIYDEEKVNNALNVVGWQVDRVISPLEDLNDQEVREFFTEIAKQAGEELPVVLRKLGRMNIYGFRKWFPSYFERKTLKGFISLMDDVHTQITKKIEGARPPRILIKELSPTEVELQYISTRGFFDYLIGLLEGSGEVFGEKLEWTELERGKTPEGHDFLTLRVKFEKEDGLINKHKLSKLLSLGLIRKVPLKIAILSAIIFGAAYILPDIEKNLTTGLIYSALVLIVVFLVSVGNLIPMKDFKEELERMGEFDFSGSTKISTGDEFEGYSSLFNTIKDNIKQGFLVLKGGTDDMYRFTKDFGEIASNMQVLSNDISGAVKEVADGAVHQAEETEKAVAELNNNINNINSIADSELKEKERLEETVEAITRSHADIERVTTKIDEVKSNFASVNSRAEELARNAQDITTIVTTVATISDQTELLALNAAIEAARAGEMGRGFAVVAEEVRKLAESSKEAVNTINDNLQRFTGEINLVVEEITSQFEQLEESNKTLIEVSQENTLSTEKVIQVAEQISKLVEDLSGETARITTVFDGIHALTAIAQENSASSEEMSATVTEYSEKIKDMTGYIQELEQLTLEFKGEVKRYII